jgi:hypothetical protein
VVVAAAANLNSSPADTCELEAVGEVVGMMKMVCIAVAVGLKVMGEAVVGRSLVEEAAGRIREVEAVVLGGKTFDVKEGTEHIDLVLLRMMIVAAAVAAAEAAEDADTTLNLGIEVVEAEVEVVVAAVAVDTRVVEDLGEVESLLEVGEEGIACIDAIVEVMV